MGSPIRSALLVNLALAAILACPYRRATGQETPSVPITPTTAEHLRRVLDKTVDIDFQSVPLKQVLDQLRREHQIPIYFEGASEADQASTPVSLKLRRVRLGAALTRLLSQVGLGWIPDGGDLQITPPETAEEFTVNRAYQVSDLLLPPSASGFTPPSQADYDRLANLIQKRVEPNDWFDVGGPV